MASNLEFLDKTVLETVVKKETGSNAFVVNIDKSILPTGDNFNGNLMRIKIRYRLVDSVNEEELSIVAKYLPNDAFQMQLAEEMKSFKREMLMYETTLNQMYNFAFLATIAPKPYLILKDPIPTLLLEDLCTLNYNILPRRNGLDLKHCTFVLEKLACFHATSVALQEKSPNSMEIYDQALFSDIFGMRDGLVKGFQELIQTCRRLPELNKYVSKLETYEKNLIKVVVESSQPDPSFNVLNHGDLWSNNMMFSYNTDGTIRSVRFLDFQTLHFSSPTLDLHVFLAVSTSPETKLHTKNLIEYYYKNLISYLEKLQVKVKPPSWNDFFIDFQSRICYGIAAGAILLAFSRSEGRSDASISNFVNVDGKDGFRYHAFNNEMFIKEITSLLLTYDRLGIF